MPHGIMARDAMYYTGEKPWHGLGEAYEDMATFDEALDRAKLRWTVSLRKIKTVPEAGFLDRTVAELGEILISGKFAIVRDDTREVFEVVSDQYRPLQNAELAQFGKDLFDTDEKIVETAGSLFNGRRVWFLAKLPDDILVGGKDRIEKYVVLATGHDGSLAVHVVNSAVRVVCNNTLMCALTNAPLSYRIMHTETLRGKVSEARKQLKLTFAYYEAFETTMNELAQTTFPEPRFEQLAYGLIPEPKDPNALTEKQRENIAARRIQLLKTYEVSPTVDRGIAYGAFNAVTQWTDHVRDADRKQTTSARESRLEKLWFGDDVAFKQKAIEQIRALSR